jgi:ketosteroid isomerase-like protein
MSENERVVRRFYDRFDGGDVSGAAQQYAEQCEGDFPAFGARCHTRQEVLDVCQGWRTAFPDGRVDVVKVLGCGDTIVVEWDSFGTWTGPPSGEDSKPNARGFRRRGCAVTEVRGGQIVRCRDYFDRANMYGPLGLLAS